ncbi:MAG: UDP-N-acetylglucosamine 2-epimerase (non-hydrolyzing) [Endomicrobiales bacterium]|nr:UDP-N-acetylglucosamine 2-epimerase (non-hydrolyzing) [Endomicrobiales bacterium]
MKKRKVLLVFGTRPEAIKMAPLYLELKRHAGIFDAKVCVTAQHRSMLDEALRAFSIKPDHDLNIMQDGQTLYHVTVAALARMEDVLEKEKPDLVLVHGDTTTTFAAALAAFYKRIPVGHVEAGLRSYDKAHPFPEEANRLLTDALCSVHFTPTATSKKALLRENIPAKNIFVTGNTVIDALLRMLKEKRRLSKSVPTAVPGRRGKTILVTAHRRENFGKPMRNIFTALKRIANDYPDANIVYPVHMNPNVRGPAREILAGIKNVSLLFPVNYSDMAGLMKLADFVVTDSGGIQEEAPSLGKPVLVLRQVTERPEAVRAGTVRVIGTDEKRIYGEIKRLIEDKVHYARMAKAVNPYGDGRASERTVDAIKYFFRIRNKRPADFVPGKRG